MISQSSLQTSSPLVTSLIHPKYWATLRYTPGNRTSLQPNPKPTIPICLYFLLIPTDSSSIIGPPESPWHVSANGSEAQICFMVTFKCGYILLIFELQSVVFQITTVASLNGLFLFVVCLLRLSCSLNKTCFVSPQPKIFAYFPTRFPSAFSVYLGKHTGNI